MSIKSRCILIMMTLILFYSCYQKEEGCLNPQAANFSPTSDIACNDCCTLPELKIRMSHLVDSLVLNTQDTYTNTLNQKYKILNVSYFLRFFQVNSEGINQTEGIIDTIEDIDSNVYLDDFVIVKTSTFEYTLGRINFYGQYDSLLFKIGLSPQLSQTTFPSASTNSALGINSELANGNNRLSFSTTLVHINENQLDTISLSINSIPEIIPHYALPKEISLDIGQSVIINLKADYGLLFNDINFNTEKTFMIESVMKNLYNFIE